VLPTRFYAGVEILATWKVGPEEPAGGGQKLVSCFGHKPQRKTAMFAARGRRGTTVNKEWGLPFAKTRGDRPTFVSAYNWGGTRTPGNPGGKSQNYGNGQGGPIGKEIIKGGISFAGVFWEKTPHF